MTKKKRNSKNRAAPARKPLTAGSTAIGDTLEIFAGFVRTADSFEDAAAKARADLRGKAVRLAELACGHDLIKVMSSARVAMVMTQMQRGVQPPAAPLELLTLVLAYRDRNPSFVSHPDQPASFMPPTIVAAATEAVSVGAVMSMLAAPPSDPDHALVFYSAQREIHLRNAVYPEMLLDTLRGIFSDTATERDCLSVLGLTGSQAIDIMEAARQSAPTQMGTRFERMEQARDLSLPHLQQWRAGISGTEPSAEMRNVMRTVLDALQALTTDVGEVAILDSGALATATGHDLATVEAVLDAFTLAELPDIDETIGRFFNGDNPLRTAPIVKDHHGRRMLVHDALALPAVREVIEQRLNAANRFQAYKQSRGNHVENAAVDLLAGAFPGATTYRAFRYFVPDPNVANPQGRPEDFTKRVEADGLIVIDDVAIIIEVKSVALTADARGGVVRKLRNKLRDIITEAADQADRLRQRILADGRIRLDDGAWIDVSGVREIHTIAVGLEDLSGVTTATTMLVQAGVLKPEHIPWTVSVHDLRIICELTERPAELLLYLRRRTEPLATWKYRAVDELDLYMHFLERGLYVEPDPRVIAANVPWADPPTPAEIRRFEHQRPELVLDRTGVLDAWYASQFDPGAPPADKPRLNAEPGVMALIDAVAANSSPGWLSTAATLLEVNANSQRSFARHAADLAKRGRRDGKHHSMMHIVGDTTGKRVVVLVWACLAVGEDTDAAADDLLAYVRAKKYQTHAYRAACMLFDPTGTHGPGVVSYCPVMP